MKVFLSSKIQEFRDLRSELSRGFETLYFWVYEHTSTAPVAELEACFQAIASADLFVLLVGDSIGDGTREELRHATKLGKPVLAFLREDKAQEHKESLGLALKADFFPNDGGLAIRILRDCFEFQKRPPTVQRSSSDTEYLLHETAPQQFRSYAKDLLRRCEDGEFRAAIEELNSKLDDVLTDQDRVEYRSLLGMCLRASGQLVKSDSMFQELLLETSLPRFQLALACNRLLANDHLMARQLLTESEYPSELRFFRDVLLGQLEQQTLNYKESLSLLLPLRTTPEGRKDAEYWGLLATVLATAGCGRAAIRAALRSYNLFSGPRKAIAALGLAYYLRQECIYGPGFGGRTIDQLLDEFAAATPLTDLVGVDMDTIWHFYFDVRASEMHASGRFQEEIGVLEEGIEKLEDSEQLRVRLEQLNRSLGKETDDVGSHYTQDFQAVLLAVLNGEQDRSEVVNALSRLTPIEEAHFDKDYLALMELWARGMEWEAKARKYVRQRRRPKASRVQIANLFLHKLVLERSWALLKDFRRELVRLDLPAIDIYTRQVLLVSLNEEEVPSRWREAVRLTQEIAVHYVRALQTGMLIAFPGVGQVFDLLGRIAWDRSQTDLPIEEVERLAELFPGMPAQELVKEFVSGATKRSLR